MDRYALQFERLRQHGEGALIPFVTLGDPDFERSHRVIEALIRSGADMLELGIPFSDPIADGPTIQNANLRALQYGMSTNRAFELVGLARASHPDIPLGLLVYSNLVLAYGLEEFYRAARSTGVDSILVADLPLEESEHWLWAAHQYDIKQVFLVSLTTCAERMRRIIQSSSAFIYLVAALGVTGAREAFQKRLFEMIPLLRRQTSLPICTGFGISKPEQIQPILNLGADGVIVGSAIIQLIERHLNEEAKMMNEIEQFVSQLKEQTRVSVSSPEAASSSGSI